MTSMFKYSKIALYYIIYNFKIFIANFDNDYKDRCGLIARRERYKDKCW